MDKIVCLGKNYLEHALELGDKVPEKPVIFFKPGSALLSAAQNNETLTAFFPQNQGSLHHETEVVLKLKKGGRFQTQSQALESIESMTLGLDMTLRDLQADLKKNGYPWEIAKAFKDSAIIGPWIQFESPTQSLLNEKFQFFLDGHLKQEGHVQQMRLSILDALIYVSEYFEFCAGDLVFTGTPAGVGPVLPGQVGLLKWGSQIQYQVKWSLA